MGRLYPRTMNLPTKAEAQQLLEQHVQDTYQRHHALMVATAMEGYANLFQEDPNLWYVTGRLHDIDFEQHPESHPRESLQWFNRQPAVGVGAAASTSASESTITSTISSGSLLRWSSRAGPGCLRAGSPSPPSLHHR